MTEYRIRKSALWFSSSFSLRHGPVEKALPPSSLAPWSEPPKVQCITT